jgi:hypothetical protein
MKVLGKTYDEKTLMRYSSTLESLNSARRIELLDGKAKGTEAIEVITTSGLELLILVDRGLDIARARYRGVNVGFMSKNGITGRIDTNPYENEFLHYFTGGLLTTCGLRSAGGGNRDENGEYHPSHGRISTIPAQELSIVWKDKETLEISGILRETGLYGSQLKLHRTITVHASDARVAIHDELENESVKPEQYMLLYHVNFGFPFLQEGCRIEFEKDSNVTPMTEDAQKGKEEYMNIIAPDDNYPEQCFFHIQKGDKNGIGHAVLINPALSIKAELTQSLKSLPYLLQWKSMQSGDYALALEPCNTFCKGRTAEIKNGTIKTILPFEKECLDFELRFSILE